MVSAIAAAWATVAGWATAAVWVAIMVSAIAAAWAVEAAWGAAAWGVAAASPIRALTAADLAAWLWTSLLHPKSSGTYNVGSYDAHSIREVAECVARHSAGQPRVTVAKRANSKRPAQRYVPDIGRARLELGLDVWTPFEQAVQKTIEFNQQFVKTNL
jgi:nucleoside-diphosphate-sugar epimerase